MNLSVIMKKNSIYKIIILIIIMASLIFLVATLDIKLISMQQIKQFIEMFGPFSLLVFGVIFNLKTLFVVVPYVVFVLIGGSLFGSFVGFLISVLCVLTTSTIAFSIARYAGKEKMQRYLKGKLKDLDMKAGENGFNIILFMRLSSLFPMDILSYAAGLTQIKYSQFILATVIGTLPETFSLSLLGDNIKNPKSKEFVFSVCLVLLTAGISILVQKVRKQKV